MVTVFLSGVESLVMVKIKRWISDKRYDLQYRFAKNRYEKARPEPYFLPDEQFQSFLRRYANIEAKPFQDYSIEAMMRRGQEKADKLFVLISEKKPSVLEIGAADGFVLKELLARGAKRAVNVDISDNLNPEVKKAGVELKLISAENMSGLESNAFDLIYSWGTFEHILNIKKVMAECTRLLKPGGVIYVEAGPLYYSPWGYHYYSILKVPYIHLLFRPGLLDEYALKKKGKQMFPWTSGNSFSVYLELIQNFPPDIFVEDFWHGYDWFSSDMIIKYPQVFRSKRVPFDDFFIDTVRLTLKKK